MEFISANIRCPNCGRPDRMVYLIGKNVGHLDMKCLNCYRYYNFDELMSAEYEKDQYPLCMHCVHENDTLEEEPCSGCMSTFLRERVKPGFVGRKKSESRASAIRSMTDVELAEFLRDVAWKEKYNYRGVRDKAEIAGGKTTPWLEWLEQEDSER